MPIRYEPTVTLPPPSTTFTGSQASKFTWTSPAGRVTDLAQFGDPRSGIAVPPGAVGIGMPAYQFFESESPSFSGSQIDGWRREARQIDLPIQIWGSDRLDLLDRWRRLVYDMRPSSRGPGKLTLTRFDGESRHIYGYYASGLEGLDDDAGWGVTFISAVATLKCPDPDWLGATFTRTFTSTGGGGAGDGGGSGVGLFFPILPLVLAGGINGDPDPEPGEGSPVGSLTITNQGDAEAWPVITFTGPCDSITLTNTATGQSFSLAGGVAEGKTLTVDSRPLHRTVLETTPGVPGAGQGDLGTPEEVTNRYGDITGPMWPLIEGDNIIEITTPGSAATSNVTISYEQRWLTGY